ncbi:hypothetical protein [Nocardioides jejuensis]|uniref:ImmA/IrrE family metallo-endopeptidase n=1 Tax=Nocardioides jejuensis TaxID=2502782 RepID=A0A4R1BYB0_9ACTN|nr:hypothetical protein [Nocardioides jejuensis]TCJ23053.1 hypothetical protein EPD65_11870 [Nocardioides jejuensis]
MEINPWRRLRELAHVTLLWHDGGSMGHTSHRFQAISLRRGMTWAERRCTVQHELLHLERGWQPLGLRAKDEELVRRETSRLMLPSIETVGEAIAWSHSIEEAADELGVDVYVLRKRLRHLHPAERHYLSRRLTDD